MTVSPGPTTPGNAAFTPEETRVLAQLLVRVVTVEGWVAFLEAGALRVDSEVGVSTEEAALLRRIGVGGREDA